jgi:hypothetical protein
MSPSPAHCEAPAATEETAKHREYNTALHNCNDNETTGVKNRETGDEKGGNIVQPLARRTRG